jgi:protein-S-isoprenylcysteine O-methyltransferase Ste14
MLIFIITWSVWLLSELTLTGMMRSKSSDSKKLDKNSELLIWGTILVSITAGVMFMKSVPLQISRSGVVSYAGLIVIILGIIVRISSVVTLRKFFTTNLAVRSDHRLVQSGFYRYLRHPSYSGSLLSFTGLGLSFNNWLSLAVIFILVFLAFSYRIRVEEKLLIGKFGSEYENYMNKTWRLIPFIY